MQPDEPTRLLCLSADGVLLFTAVANAEVIPAFAGNTAKDPNLQLKLGGVGMTSVQGTGQTGIRTSAFKKGVLGNEKSATKFPRPGMNEVCPVMACVLLAVPHSYCKGRIGTLQTQDVGLLRRQASVTQRDADGMVARGVWPQRHIPRAMPRHNPHPIPRILNRHAPRGLVI